MNGGARHKIAIVIHDDHEAMCPPGTFVPALRAEFPGIEVVYSHHARQDEQALRDADVMIGWSIGVDQFRAATRLRWIYSTTTAVNQFFFPEFLASDVTLCNAAAVHGPVVAEHAMAMLFALARQVPSAVRYQRRRKWAKEAMWDDRPRPREVRGATLLVVGLGSIGSEIATMAATLGMHVIGIRAHPERGAGGAHEVLGNDALDAVIPRADFIVLAAPATPQTHALIDARRLRLCKRDAYLLNVSRGSLVDEAALVTALKRALIAGAALDVFEEEPLRRWSRLWKMPQVLITPHIGALSERAWDRHYALFVDNMRRYVAGEPLNNVVDKHRGY